jgi:hypothetical protein
MTTFRLPFNGRNLAGMDSQVLRPIITELYEVEVEVEEEDGFEEEEDPVVAKHHKTELKKQDKSDVVFIFHKTENLSTSHPAFFFRKVDGNRQGNAPTHLEQSTSSPPATSKVILLRRRSPWIGWPLR